MKKETKEKIMNPTGKKMKRRVLAYKVTRDKLIKHLEELGWTFIRWQGDNFVYPTTPRKERIAWELLTDRIEATNDYNNCFSCSFYYKDCKLERLDFDTLCLSAKNNKSIFILFHNFDKKESESPASNKN